jgi:hypothetical protein
MSEQPTTHEGLSEFHKVNRSALLFVTGMDGRRKERTKPPVPQLLMQEARNDQLFRPVRS